MTTFMANKQTIERKWYVLDAAGVSLGHTAAKAAALLRGKHKTDFTPHADCGDFVIVINAAQAKLTGKKLEQKMYRTHSGYVGGLKDSVGRWSLGRLKVYAGPVHKHEAQKPVLCENN